MDVGPGRGKRRGGRVRAREAEHLVSRADQFLDNGGADEAGRAGDEDTHEEILQDSTKATIGSRLSG